MKCLSIGNGDVNEAIQLLLETVDESGIDFSDNSPCQACVDTYSTVQYTFTGKVLQMGKCINFQYRLGRN